MVRVSEAISYGFAELQIQQAQRSDRYCGVVDIVKLRRFVVNEFQGTGVAYALLKVHALDWWVRMLGIVFVLKIT